MKNNQQAGQLRVVESSAVYPNWYLSDVWSASDLGFRDYENLDQRNLSFKQIRQNWLKSLVKKFVRFQSSTKKFSTLRYYLKGLNIFSQFLAEFYSLADIDSLTRSTVLDYLSYLKENGCHPRTRRNRLSALYVFLEVGAINNWFSIPPHIILKEDFPKPPQPLPRYIPEEVMQQLNQHLERLPEPIMRMTLLIQECGLRVGELLRLPLNCLKRDSQGNPYIQFMRWKMDKEATLPISQELAMVIQEQQHYILDNLGKEFNYLFCAKQNPRNKQEGKYFQPKPAIMRDDSFIKFINDLAEEYNIRDSTSKRWHFQSHQFRHTVGTRMINNGVPQYIVQRYLGHESATMTSVYAHIHDETLKREIEKYHETRVINIAGQVVELERSCIGRDEDMEWFKKTVLAMALPHGWCSRPKLLGHCNLPPNSCLNCVHLRTNKNFLEIFKDELKRTNEVLAKARRYGWEVQVRMNEPIKANLEKMIAALETDA